MGMKETILADLKTAMKNQDAAKLSAIRMLQSAIKNKEIELRPNAIADQDIMAVIKKMCNQHKDSIEQFTTANRLDLVENEKAQLKILEAYLPKQMSREEIEKLVSTVIAETNASSAKDMGTVMKAVLAKAAGLADGKVVSELVKSKLT
jgi:uncharacterized protein YqeY